jgi:hypothetical protein
MDTNFLECTKPFMVMMLKELDYLLQNQLEAMDGKIAME